MQDKSQIYAEALQRASNPSDHNCVLVAIAAQERGLSDAEPGLNVLTYNAWRAKGRYVRKGEKALCKLPVFFVQRKADGTEEKRKTFAAVFHISQTEKDS